jgi:predicted RNA-binding protein YlxR (DUF448 family)
MRPLETTGRAKAAPLRTCIGCQKVAPVSELVRVSCDVGGSLALGVGQAGRGAWLCRDSPRCFELATRRRAFSRALRRPVTPDAIETLGALLSSTKDRPSAPTPAVLAQPTAKM